MPPNPRCVTSSGSRSGAKGSRTPWTLLPPPLWPPAAAVALARRAASPHTQERLAAMSIDPAEFIESLTPAVRARVEALQVLLHDALLAQHGSVHAQVPAPRNETQSLNMST